MTEESHPQDKYDSLSQKVVNIFFLSSSYLISNRFAVSL
jgi:hypothetical protein